ncbi:MAG: hypothetical protein HQ541_18710, partial [Mariniphaga sp.]|nr:hypothetical protein [Mariniphaga sp.]
CVTDMLRATKELTASHNLSTNMTDELYIAGYSMGGWATLCLQKAIETDYSDEFNLKASACSAGPYDLLFINSHILALENYPMPYFLGYMLDSYTKLGDITNNISDIVNEPYASKIPILYDGTLDGEQINNQLTTSVDDLLTTEYRDGFLANPDFSSVRLTLLNNSVIAWNLTTPLAILHGAEDDFVTPQVSENLYEDFLSKGASENLVQISIFPDIDHPAGIIPCGIASINWFLQIKDSS